MTIPVVGAPRLVYWLARTIAEQAEREILDEGRVRGQLMELQMRFDAGEMTAEEYDRLEGPLLEALRKIREAKERHPDAG